MPVLTKINSNVIADDAITGDMLGGSAYLANTATQNITGTYSENRLYTSDAYTLSGNATINSELILSSVKPNSDIVLTAGGAYTITGTGILSGGSLYGRNILTGMTGELSSSVTGTPAITVEKSNIKILNGIYGPYVTNGKVNVKVPKDVVADKPVKVSVALSTEPQPFSPHLSVPQPGFTSISSVKLPTAVLAD